MTGERILVIDDDQAVRFTLEAILTAAGYQVGLADNGLSGMRLFRENAPDLVITDIIMPDQEGIETIIEIRKDDPQAPIIAISGGGRYANGHFLELAQALGANAVIAKPFDLDDLLSVVRQCLADGAGEQAAGGAGGTGQGPRAAAG